MVRGQKTDLRFRFENSNEADADEMGLLMGSHRWACLDRWMWRQGWELNDRGGRPASDAHEPCGISTQGQR